MTARYAIYYAPQPNDPLTIAAAHWLGRDAFSSDILNRLPLPDLADVDIEALTADPRHYGFHATLKAPFELGVDQTEDKLMAALVHFCADFKAFDADIAVRALSHFIAFGITSATADMQALHETCVRAFEPFRAPLSEVDIARRRKANLSVIQDERLLVFGYPYIFEDFRFHMTLTGAVKDQHMRGRIVAALQVHFRRFAGPHKFWGLSLFKQDDRTEPFKIIQQSAFGR